MLSLVFILGLDLLSLGLGLGSSLLGRSGVLGDLILARSLDNGGTSIGSRGNGLGRGGERKSIFLLDGAYAVADRADVLQAQSASDLDVINL